MAEETTPTAPAEAPKAPESEAQPNNKQEAPADDQKSTEAPDMHGFTSEELADMRKFYDSQGGYKAVKSKLSNPEKYQSEPQQQAQAQPSVSQDQPQQPQQPQPLTQKIPEGAVAQDAIIAEMYFKGLAQKEAYAPIAKDIESGALLKEMNSLGIQVRNPDGSFNDSRINAYLSLKAQTVPAQPTSTEPEQSAAPTVDYVQVGETIKDASEAYAVLQQDAALKARGLAGHPRINDAEAFLKGVLNPDTNKDKK